MVVYTGTRQLKIIWNLIHQNSEDNYESLSAENRALNTHYGFTMRKSGRFRFLTDLELQWNLSLI